MLCLTPLLAQPHHDEAGDSRDRNGREQIAGHRQVVRNAVPCRPHRVSDTGDDGRVDRSTDQAENPEAKCGHARKPGHDRGERPDERQRPAKRDGPRSAACQESLGPVEIRLRDQEVPAELLDQRALGDAADPVRNVGPCHLGERAEDDDEGQAEVALVGQDAAEAEGDLGRDRYAACLEEAKQDNGGVPGMDEKRVHNRPTCAPLWRTCPPGLLQTCRYHTSGSADHGARPGAALTGYDRRKVTASSVPCQ